MNKTYIHHNDPGHGWLAVSRKELEDLGIPHLISRYSYQNGETVYLEEDSDADRFIDAWEAKHGHLITIEDRYVDGQSRIRGYAAYVPEIRFMAPFAVQDVSTVEEFLDKYILPGGILTPQYYLRIANQDLARHGYVILDKHDSATSEIVVFIPPASPEYTKVQGEGAPQYTFIVDAGQQLALL